MWELGYSKGRRRGGGSGVSPSGNTGICIPLSSVTGWERWRDVGATHSRELWQGCGRGSGISDAMLQDLTITPCHLASAGRRGDAK